jgi:hypothetical protein
VNPPTYLIQIFSFPESKCFYLFIYSSIILFEESVTEGRDSQSGATFSLLGLYVNIGSKYNHLRCIIERAGPHLAIVNPNPPRSKYLTRNWETKRASPAWEIIIEVLIFPLFGLIGGGRGWKRRRWAPWCGTGVMHLGYLDLPRSHDTFSKRKHLILSEIFYLLFAKPSNQITLLNNNPPDFGRLDIITVETSYCQCH